MQEGVSHFTAGVYRANEVGRTPLGEEVELLWAASRQKVPNVPNILPNHSKK